MSNALRNTARMVLAILLALNLGLGFEKRGEAREYAQPVPTPEFNHRRSEDWINSPPLSWADLRGKVVLVDFWTFGCWNCYRSFPWLNELEQRLAGQDFLVIGVHTPEFEHEKTRDRVVEKTGEFALRHPVMMDNDYSYWKAIGNRYWPTFYLVDKQGRLRGHYVGETHAGDDQAKTIESHINRLLAE